MLKVVSISSPSYEGVDWNSKIISKRRTRFRVLPRMREWIEMTYKAFALRYYNRSPSYEGVDWNIECINTDSRSFNVLPRMREWIEITKLRKLCNCEFVLPRMREWIEITVARHTWLCPAVLPRMREWIEIQSLMSWDISCSGSPSYEGVDWNYKAS